MTLWEEKQSNSKLCSAMLKLLQCCFLGVGPVTSTTKTYGHIPPVPAPKSTTLTPAHSPNGSCLTRYSASKYPLCHTTRPTFARLVSACGGLSPNPSARCLEGSVRELPLVSGSCGLRAFVTCLLRLLTNSSVSDENKLYKKAKLDFLVRGLMQQTEPR